MHTFKLLTILSLSIGLIFCFQDPSKITCETDDDCSSKFYYCKAKGEGTSTCEHKSFFPMYVSEYVGSFITILMMFIANCGGSAVGGTITPIVMAFYGYDIKMGIAISNSTVIFSGFLRYILNFKERHPRGGLLINYSYITVMFPSLYIGATFGVIAYVLIPSLIIAILLTLILLAAAVYTTTKSILIYKVESAERKEN